MIIVGLRITRGFYNACVALSGEINMAIQSENSTHACLQFLELSFAWIGGEGSVAACSDESEIYTVNCTCAFSKLFQTR